MPKLSPLASVSATRKVLEAHGLATKKALGQHFLINDGIIARICDLAELTGEDTVLEVGPGIGTLTLGLLAKAKAVVAIERDEDLSAVLADTCSGFEGTFALIQKDALELAKNDVRSALAMLSASFGVKADLCFPNKFIANLPYAVAATLVLDYFERFPELQSATIMVQSEVADRMCAQPGTKAYGAYTVKLGLHAASTGRFTVGPKNFFPPPRVDSTVVRLDRVALRDPSGEIVSPADLTATAIMADAAFANRRKTILNSCRAYFAARGEEGASTIKRLPGLFETAGIAPTVRGEALGISEFLKLGQAYLFAMSQ